MTRYDSKRTRAVLLATLTLLSAVAGVAAFGGTAFAQSDLVVDGDGAGEDTYATIGAALSNASSGDTIVVRDGTYEEAVVVDEDVTLQAENETGATIQYAPSSSTGQATVMVTADGATVSGFVVERAAASDRDLDADFPTDFTQGIRVSGSDVTVEDNEVVGENFEDGVNNKGIMVLDDEPGGEGDTVTGVNISDNDVSGFAGPLSFAAYYGGTVSDVTFSGNSLSGELTDGISVGEQNGGTVDVSLPDYEATAETYPNTTTYFETESDALEFGANASGVVVQDADGDYVVGSGMSIQDAIDDASQGDEIVVEAGTYSESLSVSVDDLMIRGAGNGADPASNSVINGSGIGGANTGITVGADNVTLRNFNATSWHKGIQLNSIDDITIDGVSASANGNTGLDIPSPSSVSGLAVSDSHFDHNQYGIYMSQSSTPYENGTVDAKSMVTKVVIEDTTLVDNIEKGIYTTKLDNTKLDNLTVTRSGTNPQGPYNNGIDINLKYDDYSNITVANSTFENAGLLGTEPDISGALVIKARDDGSYSPAPANLSDVEVRNNNFTASDTNATVALRLGEPGAANYGPTDVTLESNEFSDYDRLVWDTTTDSGLDLSNVLSAENSEFPGSAVVLEDTSGSAIYESEEAALDTGGVVVSDNGTPQSVHESIQAGVDAAESDETVRVSNGTYTLDSRLDNFTEGVSLVGESEAGVVINGSQLSGHEKYDEGAWTVYVNHSADNVSLERFTVENAPHDAVKANFVEGLEISNVTVSGSVLSEVDLNNVRNATLTDVTLNGEDTPGVGLALSAVENVSVSGLETSGNRWAGVGIFPDDPQSVPSGYDEINQPDDITIDDSTFGEAVPVYTQAGGSTGIGDLTLPNFEYTVENPTHKPDSDPGEFVFYYKGQSLAVDFATNNTDIKHTGSHENSSIQELTRDESGVVSQSDTFIVDEGMSIQAAVDAANDGDTIEVANGTYDERVQIGTENVTLVGSGGPGVDEADQSVINSSDGPVVQVNAPNVEVSGFVVTGAEGGNEAGQGVDVNGDEYDTANVSLTDLVVRDNHDRALVVDYTDNATIENVVVRDNYDPDAVGDEPEDDWETSDDADGINLWYTNDSQVVDVRVLHNGDNGVYANGNDNRFENVTAKNNGDEGLDISSERVTGGAEVVDLNSSDNNAEAIEIEGNDDSANVTIENAYLADSPRGLFVRENNDGTVTVQNSEFENNTVQVLDNASSIDVQSVFESATFDQAVVADSGDDIYSTIQDGLDAATAGDTVEVASDTYTDAAGKPHPKTVAITTDNITLEGSTADRPVLDGNGTVDDGIVVAGADNVTIRNFVVRDYGTGVNFAYTDNVVSETVTDLGTENLTLSNVRVNDSRDHGIKALAGPTHQDVSLVGVNASDNGKQGVYFRAKMDGVAVIDSVFENNDGFAGLNFNHISGENEDIVVTNTTTAGNTQHGVAGFNVTDVLLSNNTIRDGVGFDGAQQARIENNTFTQTPGSAIELTWFFRGHGVQEPQDVDVVGNEFDGVDVGVLVGDHNATTGDYLNLKRNAFEGVDSVGVNNTLDDMTVNATHNYWGDDNGPGGVAPGDGVSITDDVDYRPWLKDNGTVNQDGVTFYVNATASAPANGSQAAPFPTIDAALDAAIAGDTIHLQNGTYDRDSTLVVDQNRTTIEGESEEGVVIDTADVPGYGISTQEGGNVTALTIENLTVVGPQQGSGANYAFKIDPTTRDVTVRNVTVTDSHKTGIDFNGVEGVTIEDVTVSNTSNGNGIAFTDTQYVTVDGATVENNSWGGIALYTSTWAEDYGLENRTHNVTILNSTIRNNSGSGVYAQNSGGVDEPFRDVHVFDNRFAGNEVQVAELDGESAVKTDVDWFDFETVVVANDFDRATTVRNSSNVTIPAVFSAIQHGVDAASEDSMVAVESGTYEEQVQIATDNVTLVGFSSPGDRPVVQGPSSDTRAVGIKLDGADNVTIQNIVVRGFDGTSQSAGIKLSDTDVSAGNTVSGLQLFNVKLVDNHQGLWAPVNWADVENRGAHSDWVLYDVNASENADRGIWIQAGASDVTVTGSEFHDNHNGVDFGSSPVDREATANDDIVVGNVTATGNNASVILHDATDPLVVESSLGGGVSLNGAVNATVAGNTITGATDKGYGVRVTARHGSGDTLQETWNVSVVQNTFVGVEGEGVHVGEHNGSVQADFLEVHANDLSSVSDAGVNNTLDVDVNATYNYWGASDGPGGEGSGTGATVSENVTFRPFFTNAAMTEDSTQPPEISDATLTAVSGDDAVGDGDTVRVSANVTAISGVDSVTVDARPFGGVEFLELTDEDGDGVYEAEFEVDATSADVDAEYALTITAVDYGGTAATESTNGLTLSTDSETRTWFTISDKNPLNTEIVDVTVTVSNLGDRSADRTITLLVDGDEERSKDVTVPAGQNRTKTFEHRFSAGEHTVEVNDSVYTTAPQTVVAERATNPDADVSITSPNASEAFATDDVTVAYDPTDADKGIAAVNYSVDDGDEQSITDLSRTEIELEDLADGKHNVTLTLVDHLGNDLASDSVTFDVDSTEPVVTIDPARTDAIGANAPVDVNFTVADDNYASAEFQVHDGTTVVYSEDVSDELADGEATVTWDGTEDDGSPLGTGQYDLVLNATDAVGNTAEATETDVDVDNTPPTAGIVSVDPSELGSGETMTVNVTADDEGTGDSGVDAVDVTLRNGNYRTTQAATYVEGDDIWTATFDAADLDRDGTYAADFTATDGAGNEYSTSGSGALDVDTTEPSVSAIIDTKNDSAGYVNVTVAEDVESKEDIGLSLTNSTNETVDVSALEQVENTDTYSGTFEFEGSGEYSLEANATDDAGNLGETDATANITVKSLDEGETFSIDGNNGTVVEFTMNESVDGGVAALTSSDTPLQELGTNVGSTFLNGELDENLSDALRNATIRIPVEGNVPEEAEKSDINISRYNETDEEWNLLPTEVENVSGTGYFVTTVEHFSTYGPVNPDETSPSIDTTSLDPDDGDQQYDYDTDEVDVTVEYSDNKQVDAGNVTVLWNGTDVTGWSDASVSTSEATFTATDLVGSGDHNVTVVVGDTADNTNRTEVLFAVEKDEDAPDVTQQFESTFDYGTQSVPVEFDFDDSLSGVDKSSVDVEIDGSPVDNEDATVTTDGFEYDASGLDSGSHDVTLNVSDNKGNHFEDTWSFTIADDEDDPTVTSTLSPTPTDGVLPIGTSRATIELQYSDPTSSIDASAIEVRFDGTDVTNETVIKPGSLEYEAFGLENGTTHTLSADIHDAEGHVVTETVTFEIDAPPVDDGGDGSPSDRDRPADRLSRFLSDGETTFDVGTTVSQLGIDFPDRDVSGTVSVQSLDARPESVTPIPDATEIAFVDVSVPSRLADSEATLRLTVDDDAVGDVDPSSLVVYHYDDGEWTTLETTVVSSSDEGVVLDATTPGFSLFAVGAADAQETPGPDEGTPEPDEGTPEPDEGTPEPDEGTPGPDTSTPVEEPSGFDLVTVGIVVAILVALLGLFALARRTT